VHIAKSLLCKLLQSKCVNTSYNCYSNRTLPIMEIIHFAMVNLSIKIILIISLFVILKHSINLPALTLESHYCRSKHTQEGIGIELCISPNLYYVNYCNQNV
jgi:hypothetical protein